MKKIIVSMVMCCALLAPTFVSAQDKAECTKTKTECTQSKDKKCSKEKSETCKKSDTKSCCKGDKTSKKAK